MPRVMIWVGSVFGALGLICCFTPLLPIVLGGLGLTGLLSVLYQDAVLLPVMTGGILLAMLGLWLKRHKT